MQADSELEASEKQEEEASAGSASTPCPYHESMGVPRV